MRYRKDLKDLKKFLKIYLSFFISIVVGVQASSSSPLSKTKKEILSNEKQQNEKSSDILEFDWINPIGASYTHTESDITNPTQTTDSFSISLNQPVFKSGGIYYAIKYAKANREFLRFATSLKERSLLKSAYELVLSIKNLDLKIKKQRCLIDNAKIDIVRKKEQYLSGVLDSSYLDNAILKKNSLEIALLDMLSSKADLLKSFKTLSDMDYETVKLPHLKLVDLSSYLKNNISIKSQMANAKEADYIKKMTISNYFPTISLFANYSDNRVKIKNTTHESHKSYGISVSMPLIDINRRKNIELQRLKYMESKLNLIDKKRAEKELYDSVVKKVKIIRKKIALAKKQEQLYQSLLKTTKDLYSAGEKSIYDVKTMENSLKSTKYDKYIYENDIDILLLKLFEHFDGKI